MLRRALKGLLGQLPAASCGLVLTEPYLNLPSLREAAVRLALQELGFASVLLSSPAPLALRWHAHTLPSLPANLAGCGLVLDAGFSFTHAVSELACQPVGAGGEASGQGSVEWLTLWAASPRPTGPRSALAPLHPPPPSPNDLRCPYLTGACCLPACAASTWAARRSPTGCATSCRTGALAGRAVACACVTRRSRAGRWRGLCCVAEQQPFVLLCSSLLCRSINMMDEGYLLEHIKEQLCFVSTDLPADLAAARKRASPHR